MSTETVRTLAPDPDLQWLEDHLFALHAPSLPAGADPEELRAAIRLGLLEGNQGFEEEPHV